jgi:hypothetical protein
MRTGDRALSGHNKNKLGVRLVSEQQQGQDFWTENLL